MGNRHVLIYVLRRDLRLADNPIFHAAARSAASHHGGVSLTPPPGNPFSHVLPLYIFHPGQIETVGLAKKGEKSPFPPCRSRVGGFPRMSKKRTKFLSESLWDLKTGLQKLNSKLELRVGESGQVMKELVSKLKSNGYNVTVWITKLWASEELQEEDAIRSAVCQDAEMKTWVDEGYLIDDRDIPYKASEIPDVFTTFRKAVEPLRENPRQVLPVPESLPPPPADEDLAPQAAPFIIPDNLHDLVVALHEPLVDPLNGQITWPEGAIDPHPFSGGEHAAMRRMDYLIRSGNASTYKDTRNGLVGEDYSCKTSAWLALGCISARQMHQILYEFEEGRAAQYSEVHGFGKGENKGTAAIRFELLWRDYMRHCGRKFGMKMFNLYGFRDKHIRDWDTPDTIRYDPAQTHRDGSRPGELFYRWITGRTGIGMIDASAKEIFLSGYTSNRARQNSASFLAKHLNIDWRLGAEWYEAVLVDYDVFSNWANWQYIAGVGNDPRGEARLFNPVKQSHDYDKDGEFVKMWIPELRPVENVDAVYQPWKLSDQDREKYGLKGVDWVEAPLKKIHYQHREASERKKDFPKTGYSGHGRPKKDKTKRAERKQRAGQRMQAVRRESEAMEEGFRNLVIS